MFNLLVTSVFLYLMVGMTASIVCCAFRPRKSPVVFAASVIIGTMAAFITTVLFAPALGPHIAGIYLIPSILAALVAVILLEFIAPKCCESQTKHNNVVHMASQRPHDQKRAA
jgi:uncharacterized membrane protein YeaQ/YmgE (transglycosylase-associated protein family)